MERIDTTKYNPLLDRTLEVIHKGVFDETIVPLLEELTVGLASVCRAADEAYDKIQSLEEEIGRRLDEIHSGDINLALAKAEIERTRLVTDRVAYAENKRLREENDKLRANALEWVKVTDDPKTLPKHYQRVLVCKYGSKEPFVGSLMTPNEVGPVKLVWIGLGKAWLNVCLGDRWACIPEVPDA